MWLVHYKGNVSPTQSGTYHFVGGGDDVLMVRFNGKLVLSRNWDNPQFGRCAGTVEAAKPVQI